jgi:hypothetical protein
MRRLLYDEGVFCLREDDEDKSYVDSSELFVVVIGCSLLELWDVVGKRGGGYWGGRSGGVSRERIMTALFVEFEKWQAS